MERRIDKYSAKYVGLAWNFRVNPSSCDNPDHYEEYIKLNALGDMVEGLGTTHILVDDKKIFGYITLRASSVIETVDGKLLGEPALEISELAVAADSEGQAVGTLLVNYAITVASWLNSDTLGIRYIVLCADPSAVGFYEKKGFEKLTNYGKIPREGWNDNCIPMRMRIK